MTAATCAETMISDDEQKKSLVFNLFKFRVGVSHSPGNSIFACPNKYAYDTSGS